jgi:ABC-2 type transport system permease protein
LATFRFLFFMSSCPNFPAAHAWRVAFALIWVDLKQGLRKHAAAASLRDRLLKVCGLLFGLGFFALLHFGAYALVTYTRASPSTDPALLMRGLSSAIWAFLLFVMISGGLVRAIVVLHEQDDSDLLLSSPVSPRAVLAARLFGNALQSCVVDGFIIVPYIDILLFSHWKFMWGYPVWFALAVIVTCLDGLFSFGMIRWFGLRRARLLSQAVPFILIFGVTFFAGSLSVSIAQMNAEAGNTHMSPDMQAHFIALARSPLAWIARAAAGDPWCVALIFAAAAAIAWFTLRQTERAFVEGTQALAESSGPARPSADFPFRSHLLFLEVRKNVRLVVRTPMMLVQCIAQVLTPVGIAFVLGREDVSAAVAFFVIFVAGVLSGMFTIAAGTVEECDDLRMSPRNVLLFRFGKIVSGCLAPVALALLAAAGLLVFGKPLAACGVLLAGVPLGIASSVVGETFATPVRPGVRPKLLSDPIMMIPLLGLQIVSGLVAAITIFAVAFSPAVLGLGLLASYLLFMIAIGLAQLRKPLF